MCHGLHWKPCGIILRSSSARVYCSKNMAWTAFVSSMMVHWWLKTFGRWHLKWVVFIPKIHPDLMIMSTDKRPAKMYGWWTLYPSISWARKGWPVEHPFRVAFGLLAIHRCFTYPKVVSPCSPWKEPDGWRYIEVQATWTGSRSFFFFFCILYKLRQTYSDKIMIQL